MICSRRNVNMACDVDFISMSRNGHALSKTESSDSINIRRSKQTMFELFFCKKIPLSRRVEYVMDGSMDQSVSE